MKQKLHAYLPFAVLLAGVFILTGCNLEDFFGHSFFGDEGTYSASTFQDDNGNGNWDSGEAGLPGVEMEVVCVGADGVEHTIASGQTNDLGYFTYSMEEAANIFGENEEYECHVITYDPDGYRLTTDPEDTHSGYQLNQAIAASVSTFLQSIPGLLVNQPGLQLTPDGFEVWSFPSSGFTVVKGTYAMGEVSIIQSIEIYETPISDPAQILYLPADLTAVPDLPTIGVASVFGQGENTIYASYVQGNTANYLSMFGGETASMLNTAQQLAAAAVQTIPENYTVSLPSLSDLPAVEGMQSASPITSFDLRNESGQPSSTFIATEPIILHTEVSTEQENTDYYAMVFNSQGDMVFMRSFEPGADLNLGNIPFPDNYTLGIFSMAHDAAISVYGLSLPPLTQTSQVTFIVQ